MQPSPVLISLVLLVFCVAAAPAQAQLRDGEYTIQQQSNNRYVDAHETAGNDYRVVTRPQQYNQYADSQIWILKQVGDAYTIQQKSNNRYVDAYEDAGNDYRLVTRTSQKDSPQWLEPGADRQPHPTQLWILKKVGDTYTIQQKSNNRYVDAHESAGNDYRLVSRTSQKDSAGQRHPTQLWVFNRVIHTLSPSTLSDICSEGLANEHAGMVPPSYLPAPDTVEQTEIIELPARAGGPRFTVPITRDGDLINEILVENEADIEYVELEIGGSRIDRIYSDMFPNLRQLYGMRGLPFQLLKGGLPLIALQYHEVRLNFEMRALKTPIIHANYIRLKSEERRQFAQTGHDRRIYQIQHTGPASDVTDHIRMDFKRPVVALFVKTIPYSEISFLEFDGRAVQLDEIEHANGYDIFRFAPSLYSKESHYPINFSGCDYAALNFADGRSKTVYVYAVGANVLRMMSGMGGLAYSN